MKETFWLELGFMPTEVGYCPNKRAWKKTLKALGIKGEPYPTTAGRCVSWTDVGPERKTIVLVTVSHDVKNLSMYQVVGIIAHECMHVWRTVREQIEEKKPSQEFEAYMLQGMVQSMVYAHHTRRNKPWRKD